MHAVPETSPSPHASSSSSWPHKCINLWADEEAEEAAKTSMSHSKADVEELVRPFDLQVLLR